MPSSTSSFRISDDLRARLEEACRQIGKGKNWIITRALEDYLDRRQRSNLASEARKQSLLASQADTPEERFWSKQVDTDGWQ